MTLLAGLLVQLLHIALMAVAAPTLAGLQYRIQARLVGGSGPPVLQSWRDLIRLMRKQSVLAESASAMSSHAPAACAAATVVAASLVPSFALGMTSAPITDLLMIVGLMAVARCSLALAAMDAGTALGGIAASRTVLLLCLADPALLLVMLVLALLSGSLNLDLIAAMQIENGANWRVGVVMAFAAVLLVALVDVRRSEQLTQDLSGADLALTDATGDLRVLLWFNLIGVTFLPFGMAPADAGPSGWLLGLVCWVARTLLFAVLLAVLHTVLGRLGLGYARRLLGVAALLGLLATVFLFAEMGTA